VDRGKKALETYKNNMDTIFTIVLDIRLPDMDGFQVFKELKEINRDIPIIFITGFQATYGDGYEIYREFRPHGYIVKNHENEIQMIKDTVANSIAFYKKIMEVESNKILEAKNKMMAGLLHDLKNMFSPVMMYPELMIKFIKIGKDDMVKDLIYKLKNSVDFFSANQQILFNYAKGEHLVVNFDTMNLSETINAFLEMIKIQYQERVRIEVNYHEGSNDSITSIITNKNILCCQIILNIIKNAREALSAQRIEMGDVIIDFYSFKQYKDILGEQSKIFNKSDKDLVIVLTDNAKGMPKEVEGKIFKAYHTYGKREGTGLGTWMIKNGVSDCLRGEIVLENNIEIGLTYHIWLPQNESFFLNN